MVRFRKNLFVGAGRLLLWIVPGAAAFLPLGLLFLGVAQWTDNPVLEAFALAVVEPCATILKTALRMLGWFAVIFTLLSGTMVLVAIVSRRLGWRSRDTDISGTLSLDRFGQNDSPEARKSFDQIHLLLDDSDGELPASAIMMRTRLSFLRDRPTPTDTTPP